MYWQIRMNVLEDTAAFIFRVEMSLLPWRWLVTIYYTTWDHIRNTVIFRHHS